MHNVAKTPLSVIIFAFITTITTYGMQPARVPGNFSWISQAPGKQLAGMELPKSAANIKFLANQNIGLVVTLTQDPLPGNFFAGTGVQSLHLPVPDMGAPSIAQVDEFVEKAKAVHTAGKGVAVHCRYGVGRTGTFLASLLVAEDGMTAQQAIDSVRSLRSSSISTPEQEQFVRDYYVHRYPNSFQSMLTKTKNSLGKLHTNLSSLKNKLVQLQDRLNKPSAKPIVLNKPLAEISLDELSTILSTPIIEPKDALTEADLFKLAETDGYGYKAANLQLLAKLTQKMILFADLTGYFVSVPEFVKISSNEIQNFIDQKILRSSRKTIKSLWDELINKYFGITKEDRKAALAAALNNNQFPSGFLDALGKVETTITDAFNTFIKNQTNLTNHFATSFNEATITQINEHLAMRKATNEKCMVRSTGKEDTDKLANAGGNETKANVVPEIEPILDAIKEVAVSYFGKKSMTQRLGAKDPSLLDDPFTPVLIQRMIGEKRDTGNAKDQIPSCGVMFTEEAEGALSSRVKGINPDGSVIRFTDANGKVITTGISIIQAAYGHNEGVVNSLIPVDTFYSDNSGFIYSLIRSKRKRLIPITPKDGKNLDFKENDEKIAWHPALTPGAIITLKILANLLEQYYKKPMDVEFVVDTINETIYIVQARPIVHNPDTVIAAYLNLDKLTDQEKKSGDSIGTAGGALRFISGKSDIVIEKTLGAALATYQQRTNKKSVQTIVTGEMAPSTSHEATAFRSELKPIFCTDEYQEIESWIDQQDTRLVVDMQQLEVLRWTKQPWELANLKTAGLATEGWINYPIPARVSVFRNNYTLPEAYAFPESFSTLNTPQFRTEIATFVNNFYKQNIRDMRNDLEKLLKIIKTGNENDAYTALLKVMSLSYGLPVVTYNSKLADELAARNLRLSEEIKAYAAQVIKTVPYDQNHDKYRQRLYTTRFLEALLLQKPKPTELLGADSVLAYSSQVERELQSKKTLGTEDEFKALAGTLGGFALDDTIKKKWEGFINKLNFGDTTNSNMPKFYKLLTQLNDLDMFEPWLHSSFIEKEKTSYDAQTLLANLITEEEQVHDFLETLSQKKKDIDDLNLDSLQDPAQFNKTWATFTGDGSLIDYFTNDKPNGFIASLRKTFEIKDYWGIVTQPKNSLGAVAALSVMALLIEKFDAAIKEMSHSDQYEIVTKHLPLINWQMDTNLIANRTKVDKDLLFTFKRMLIKYFLLLQKWYSLLDPADLASYKGRSETLSYLLNNQILQILLNLPTNNKDQLLTSPGFDVNGCVIGSTTDYTRGVEKIVRLEEFFTFCHQSLLAIIAKIMQKNGIQISNMPNLVSRLHNKIDGLRYSLQKPTLIGIDLKDKILVASYNFPQNLHSASIKLIYNVSQKELDLQFAFFGANHYNRWEYCSDYAELASAYNNLKVKTKTQGKGMVIDWEMTFAEYSDDKMQNILDIISTLCNVAGKHPNLFEQYFTQNRNFATSLLNTVTLHELQIKKLIELSADQKASRAFWLLPQAVELLNPDPTNYTYTGTLAKDPKIVDQLLTILQKLLEPNGRYALKSEIFAFRRQYAPDLPGGNSPNFYKLTPDNFYALAGTDDIATYKHALIKIIAGKLLSPEIAKIIVANNDLFTKLCNIIYKNLEYFLDHVIYGDVNGLRKYMIDYFIDTYKSLIGAQLSEVRFIPTDYKLLLNPKPVRIPPNIIQTLQRRGLNILYFTYWEKFFDLSFQQDPGNTVLLAQELIKKGLVTNDFFITTNAFKLLEWLKNQTVSGKKQTVELSPEIFDNPATIEKFKNDLKGELLVTPPYSYQKTLNQQVLTTIQSIQSTYPPEHELFNEIDNKLINLLFSDQTRTSLNYSLDSIVKADTATRTELEKLFVALLTRKPKITASLIQAASSSFGDQRIFINLILLLANTTSSDFLKQATKTAFTQTNVSPYSQPTIQAKTFAKRCLEKILEWWIANQLDSAQKEAIRSGYNEGIGIYYSWGSTQLNQVEQKIREKIGDL